MTDKSQISPAAHRAAMLATDAIHHLMMAHRYCAGDAAKTARDHLARAVSALDAALADQPIETEGAPV